jgi:mono/diheme cytochrome c family protein
MNRAVVVVLGAGIAALSVATTTTSAQRPMTRPAAAAQAPRMATSHQAPAPQAPGTAAAQTAMVKQYCAGCHSERGKAGGLSLAAFDASTLTSSPETTEKMIRKLRAGMMPPAGAKRPGDDVLLALAEAFETRLDRAAALNPNPGARVSQRMNRAEYANAIREMLGLDVDVTQYLPPDTLAHGFDNIAEEQGLSASVMEGYLRAASAISRLAVGDRAASNGSVIYKIPRDASQMRHVPGAPIGTRGGISVVHTFPADGEYVFKMLLHSGPTGDLFGTPVVGEQIEVSVNGERRAVLTINHNMKESDEGGLGIQTGPIHVSAGPQRISAAFIQRADGPVDDLVAPIEHTLADTNIGETFGVTALAHLREFAVTGPTRVTGVSETPSRRRIFTCRPTSAAEETACAQQIIRRLSTQAYRGVVPGDDFADLMRFYQDGRKQADFEAGIRLAVQAILANPRFVFRMEQAPQTLRAGETYRISDIDLASRLSFFLWGTVPDSERGARQAGAPHAGGSARRRPRDAVRGAVAAAAGHREEPSRPADVSALGRHARRRLPP